jgi:hypothetical protein
MTTLHIANSRTEDMVGDLAAQTEPQRMFAGASAQRMVWFAEDGDIVVVPRLPDASYVDYVTALTGTDPATLRILAPPPGELGQDLLTADRLADEGFLEQLRKAMAGRGVHRVVPIYADQTTVALARAAGVLDALPGHGFSGQGGNALVNSKAVFRAVAAGTGAAMAPGAVVARPQDAVAVLEEMLAAGHPVIVKQEYQAGGQGNDVLSRVPGVRPIGARQVVHAPHRSMVEDYVARHWAWLTGQRRHQVVIERYYPESLPVFVEFLVTDEGIELLGDGQMTMNPTFEGVVTPAVALTAQQSAELATMGRRLCEPYRLMGFRGVLTPDAVLTPRRELFFSEVNGRLSGATHHFTGIPRCLGGRAGLHDRVLVERGTGWLVPSFAAAVEALHTAGLALDRDRRAGVVLVCDHVEVDGAVRHCVIAEDLAVALEYEQELVALFAQARA